MPLDTYMVHEPTASAQYEQTQVLRRTQSVGGRFARRKRLASRRRFKVGDRVCVNARRYNPFHPDESYNAGEYGVITECSENSTVCGVRLDGDYHVIESVLPLRKKPVPHRFVHISSLHLDMVKTAHRGSPEPTLNGSASQNNLAANSGVSPRGMLDLGKVTGCLDAFLFKDRANLDDEAESPPCFDFPEFAEGEADSFWKAPGKIKSEVISGSPRPSQSDFPRRQSGEAASVKSM